MIWRVIAALFRRRFQPREQYVSHEWLRMNSYDKKGHQP